MARDSLQYDKMVEGALRGVVRESLTYAAKNGLPGNHHFYLTFRTDHPGTEISDHLRAQYPHDMTVVLQHQYWGLEVSDERFVVNLSFSNVPERLSVPYAALVSFVDPSVKFGLQFQPFDGAAPDLAKAKSENAKPETGKTESRKAGPAKSPAEVAKLEPAKLEPAKSGAEKPAPAAKAPAAAEKKPATENAADAPAENAGESGPGKIVSLDAFRKK